MRKIAVILLVGFLASFCSCAGKQVKIKVPVKRVIIVCAYNDVRLPVDELIARKALQQVFEEFSQEAGIQFKLCSNVFHEFPKEFGIFRAVSHPFLLAQYLYEVCPRGDIKLIFTNRRVWGYQLPDIAKYRFNAIGGATHVLFGYAFLFSFEESLRERTHSVFRYDLASLRHEFGHLFGLEHEAGIDSFMCEFSDVSAGEWTPEIHAKIDPYRLWISFVRRSDLPVSKKPGH